MIWAVSVSLTFGSQLKSLSVTKEVKVTVEYFLEIKAPETPSHSKCFNAYILIHLMIIDHWKQSHGLCDA